MNDDAERDERERGGRAPDERAPEGRAWRTARALFGVDLRALAALRVGCAVAILCDLAIAASDLVVFYSDDGAFPLEAHARSFGYGWGPFVHLLDGSAEWQGLLMAVAAVCALFLLLGLFTHLATVSSWLLLISLQTRNPLVLQGNDMIVRMLLFWGMFAPLGARWSLDALRRQDDEPLPKSALSVATFAMLMQVAFVYWFTAALKTDPSWRADGTAIYYALHIDLLTLDSGRRLLDHPALLVWLTHATFWLEAVGPCFAFLPVWTSGFRLLTAATFIGFHVGLAATMRLGMFPFVSCVSWLIFLPTPFWDWLERGWSAVGAAALGRRLVESLRRALSERLPDPPRRPGERKLTETSIVVNLAAAVFFLYVLAWNLRGLDDPRFKQALPGFLDKIGYSLHLDQKWAMFAPGPNKADGWYVVVGVLKDGSEVDLAHRGGRVTWDKPRALPSYYRNYRWRVFMMHASTPTWEHLLTYLASYYCREWNRDHQGERQVETVEVYFMLEEAQLGGKPDVLSRWRLVSYACGADPSVHRVVRERQ